MNCPICTSTAVVARALLDNHLELLQQGLDPLELIAGDNAEAVCKACGHVFRPAADEDSQG